MSAERNCFTRRELRARLPSRTNRRANTKQFGVGGKRESQRPRGKLGEMIHEIRQTCGCDFHRRWRRER